MAAPPHLIPGAQHLPASEPAPHCVIVGVVADVKQGSLRAAPDAEVYASCARSFTA